MNKHSNWFIISLLLLTMWIQTVSACSLSGINEQHMKEIMMDKLSHHLNIPQSEIPNGALTNPQVTFLHGLGADCKGLDDSFFSSGYHFKRTKGKRFCTHRGIIINKGFDLYGKKTIQDSSFCIKFPQFKNRDDGEYLNKNKETRSIKRIVLSKNLKKIEVFGACGNGECAWGLKDLKHIEGNFYKAKYNGQKKIRSVRIKIMQTIVPGKAHLEVETRIVNLRNLKISLIKEQFKKY